MHRVARRRLLRLGQKELLVANDQAPERLMVLREAASGPGFQRIAPAVHLRDGLVRGVLAAERPHASDKTIPPDDRKFDGVARRQRRDQRYGAGSHEEELAYLVPGHEQNLSSRKWLLMQIWLDLPENLQRQITQDQVLKNRHRSSSARGAAGRNTPTKQSISRSVPAGVAART